MLHQKFALLRERHRCGERLGAWIDSSSDWFPRPLRNVRRVAPRPAEQASQPSPVLRIELVGEQQEVAASWTHSKIEPDPKHAHHGARPQRCAVETPLRYDERCVRADDDQPRRRLRSPDRTMTRDRGEGGELRSQGPGDKEVRRDQYQVQRTPPQPDEARRPRRQTQRWNECARGARR
jgi:hypothetical protein